MAELISLKNVSTDSKIALLRELNYDSDGTYVLNSDGTLHEDKYTGDPIPLDNMLILPGSAVILDNNPLSVSSYLEEYGDVL